MSARAGFVGRLLGIAALLALGGAASAEGATKFRGPTNSSLIAMSASGKLVWVANPKADAVSVIRTDRNRVVRTIRVGDEPQSIALTPDDTRAFVANAAAGTVTVIRITNPRVSRFRARVDRRAVGRGTIQTGAEPWNIVITPDGRRVFVANSAQDTITVIDAATTRVIGIVNVGRSSCNADPNRLFQPRGLAVTADSRRLYVTSFLAFTRLGIKQATDTGREGAVCRIDIRTRSKRIRDYRVARRIPLAPQNTGFAIDKTGDAVPDATFAWPNQLQSIVIRGNQAFLPNIAASPEGPLRFNVDTQAFVNVIDSVRGRSARDASAAKFLNLHLGAREPEAGKKKLFFANVWAIGFTRRSGSANAYVVSAGSDLLVKTNVSSSGKLTFTVDDNTTRYIDLNDPANPRTAGGNAGKNPQGIVISPNGRRAYVANVVSSNVSVVDLRRDSVIKVVRTAPLPAPGTPGEVNRVGAEIFFSSRGLFDPIPGQTTSRSERLSSEGWQSCSSCHFEGWTDGVIWQFATGPRKSVPLNATFNPNDPNDQRVLNYSAIFDEVEDFEANIRNVSGPGALTNPVACFNPPPPDSAFDPNHGLLLGDNGSPNSPPCVINTFGKPNADRPQHTVTLPGSGTKVPALTALREWVRNAVRTPEGQFTIAQARGGLSSAQITAGRQVFLESGCADCHGGPKWTLSRKDFVSPPAAAEIATETNPPPRFGRPIGAQYLPRFLRDIGSYKIGRPDLDYAADTIAADELTTQPFANGRAGVPNAGLGIDFNGDGKGNGFNVPSLLGISLLPPYYHGGACETLQCVVDDIKHRTANRTKPDRLTDADRRALLVTFLKTIDADTPAP